VKKGRNSGGKDEEGQKLWQSVTRSVKAYSSQKNQLAKKGQPSKPVAASVKPSSKPPVLSKPPSSAAAADTRGFDRSTKTRLERGQLPLEGRLDMHGMTQAEAFRALQRFILSAAAHEKRTLLVITGKGLRSEGILKRMFPLWLEEPELKKYILAVTPARPKDGGTGAFYVRLRKAK
jgi:DNA-nicking Smr family endonuclease